MFQKGLKIRVEISRQGERKWRDRRECCGPAPSPLARRHRFTGWVSALRSFVVQNPSLHMLILSGRPGPALRAVDSVKGSLLPRESALCLVWVPLHRTFKRHLGQLFLKVQLNGLMIFTVMNTFPFFRTFYFVKKSRAHPSPSHTGPLLSDYRWMYSEHFIQSKSCIIVLLPFHLT